MPNTNSDETTEKLKSALWYHTGVFVDSASLALSKKYATSQQQQQQQGANDGAAAVASGTGTGTAADIGNVTATPQFIGALMELVWAQVEGVGLEVESFARHAGRTTVDTADVMMLARRNEGLKGLLERHVESERVAEGAKGKAKK